MILKAIASLSGSILVLALGGPAGAATQKVSIPPPVPAASSAASGDISPDAIADQALVIAKKSRLMRVLSEHLPEFEGLIRNRMRTIMGTMPQYAWQEQAHLQGQSLVQYYFSVYMPMASDESIYRLLKYDAENLALYADKPDVCIGYAMGTPAFAKIAPQDYVDTVTNLKADIFESAFTAPVHRDFKADLSDVRAIFMAQYQKEGFDPKDLAMLSDLTAVPAVDACRAYSQFNKTIYDLGPKDGAYVLAAFTNAAPRVKPS